MAKNRKKVRKKYTYHNCYNCDNMVKSYTSLLAIRILCYGLKKWVDLKLSGDKCELWKEG